jgi:hypothetical protein
MEKYSETAGNQPDEPITEQTTDISEVTRRTRRDGKQEDGFDVTFSSEPTEIDTPHHRNEQQPVPMFPFGRRQEDANISMEEAEQAYIASWHARTVPGINFTAPAPESTHIVPPTDKPNHHRVFMEPTLPRSSGDFKNET